MSSQAKLCPWCGKDPHKDPEVDLVKTSENGWRFWVVCQHCGACGPEVEPPHMNDWLCCEDAIAAWNKLPPSAEVEALRALVRKAYLNGFYTGRGDGMQGCAPRGEEWWERSDIKDELEALQPAQGEEIWTRDGEALQSLLLLVEVECSTDAIKSWTDQQCQLAEDWASAVHLMASDNDDVEVPPRPAFLPAQGAQQGGA